MILPALWFRLSLFLTLGTHPLVSTISDGSSHRVKCMVSKYRSVDGRCNNVHHPNWGIQNSQFLQLSAETEDGYSSNKWPELSDVAETLSNVHLVGNNHLTILSGMWADFIRQDLAIANITEGDFLFNAATSFLDASPVYNNISCETSLLSIKRTESGHLESSSCFSSTSENSKFNYTTTVHRLLISEHNRLVDAIREINPKLSNDTLYEEARRITIAQLQHITYNEFIPNVVGHATVNEWNLIPLKRGYYTQYSSAIRPGVLQSIFATVLPILPAIIFDKNQQKNLGGTTNNNLSKSNIEAFLSLGRQLKIPAYKTWKNLCANRTTESNSYYLKTLNRDDDSDIDLLAGGLLETPLKGAVFGPTFSCLIAKQFSKIKDADRFWYENDFPPTTFSKNQLQEIRQTTMAGMVCSNFDDVNTMQPKAFIDRDDYLNHPINCDQHPKLDLYQWKDKPLDSDELPVKYAERELTETVDDTLVKEAWRKAEDDVSRRKQTEFLLWSKKGGVDPKSPMGTAAAFSKASKSALILANNSLLFEFASRELLKSLGKRRRRRQILDSGDPLFSLNSISPGFFDGLELTELSPPPLHHAEGECPVETDNCNILNPFRTFSGYCNNLKNPNFGKAMTTFQRILPAVYENGINHPRLTSVTGSPLPSARLVSAMSHPDISHLHGRYTLTLMQFAQILDHDITFTPVHRGYFSSIPDCRSCDSPLTVHPECMPIPIPPGDPYFPQINLTTGQRMCLPFMRSLPGQQRLGPRDQINQNSAYLDLSTVYGSDSCMAKDLRAFYIGKLNVTIHPIPGRKDLLPQSPIHPECKAQSGYCFIGGDGRVSEQPGLTAMHTIFLREHNRIAEVLHRLNPHWNDDTLYQNTRKIFTAAYQHIVYNEFLPRILGWNAVDKYDLRVSSTGYYKSYTPDCHPGPFAEFVVAAFRIGHSLLRPHIPRMSPTYQPIEPAILLRDVFFNPDIIFRDQMTDEIVRGQASTPMENLDQFITAEITNHLFENKKIPHSGVDLSALNVQRARDHAVPSYNALRVRCGLQRAIAWEDLTREMSPDVIARFKTIYASPDDIDLFPGGLSEYPVQGGLVGPTFACIIGLQFRHLKQCDRFWYETDDPLLRFSEAQLTEIRKATLSKILCENLDVMSDMQKAAFDQPNDYLNPRLPCPVLPSIDLTLWKDSRQNCNINGRIIAVGESHLPSPCTSCICTPEGPNCASLRVTDCGRLMNEVGVDKMMQDDVCAAQCAGFVEQSIISPDPLILSSGPQVPPFLVPPERGPRFVEEIDLLPPPQLIRSRPHRRLKSRRRPFRRDFQFPTETIVI
ncbi:heme peroxidase 2 [Adelges cooleyi]|uniref:heme peroxidase 2 n=1 Tax=Adelges cooleyi TaxID=133065 RepID=UPI00217F7EB3|nr:heme peroxidase 2 [Adelges cooleyi]